MAINTSLAALDEKYFDFAHARHLLNRAGFGGTPAQIEALHDMGLNRAVDLLVDFQKINDPQHLPAAKIDADILKPPTKEQRREIRQARRSKDQAVLGRLEVMRRQQRQDDRRQSEDLGRWWMARIISTPRPLEEKLVLLWHSHFASNYRTVRDSFLMYRQHMLIRKHANGSFAELAHAMIRDPAMIRFLDNHNNHKRKPNENLARELMELFMLGEGNYTEQDIKQGARALTGYTFHDNEFVFRQQMHDNGSKSILGRKGNFDGDDFVDILLKQPACPRFVCYKLYRHFVGDLDEQVTPSARKVIFKMARVLAAKRYRLSPLLKTLFKSRHFYDPSVMAGKIKSPVHLIIGTVRALGTPTRNLDVLIDAMSSMGQRLFNPPSVAGWPGGRSWINTSTLFVRQNMATYLITGKLPYRDGWSQRDVEYEPMALLAELPKRTPETVVDHLLSSVVVGSVAAQRRDQLVAFMGERGGRITEERMVGLLMMITAMPEYQLC